DRLADAVAATEPPLAERAEDEVVLRRVRGVRLPDAVDLHEQRRRTDADVLRRIGTATRRRTVGKRVRGAEVVGPEGGREVRAPIQRVLPVHAGHEPEVGLERPATALHLVVQAELRPHDVVVGRRVPATVLKRADVAVRAAVDEALLVARVV
ncbi:MAG: hypothetical protein ACK55Z_30370, partial [bacterium]